MTEQPEDPQVIDDGASDVLAEEEVVHVPAAVEALAESLEHGSTFLPDVPDWDSADGAEPLTGHGPAEPHQPAVADRG